MENVRGEVSKLNTVISLAAVIVSVLSFMYARQKTMLDMFQERYRVYSALINYFRYIFYIDTIMTHRVEGYKPKIDDQRLKEFLDAKQRSEFLFDENIYKYLCKVEDNSNRLLSDNPKKINDTAYLESKKWLSAQSQTVNKIFLPYLKQRVGLPMIVVVMNYKDKFTKTIVLKTKKLWQKPPKNNTNPDQTV